MKKELALGLLIVSTLMLPAEALRYPGPEPGAATLKQVETARDRIYTLSNNLLSSQWIVSAGVLHAPEIVNLQTGERLARGEALFAVSFTKQQVDDAWVYLGIRLSGERADVLVSTDGASWSSLRKVSLPEGVQPALLRVGKTDVRGGADDYGDAGEVGICEFLEVQTRNAEGDLAVLTANPLRTHSSPHPETEVSLHNERGTIRAAAHTAAFMEYALPPETTFMSCRIKKGTDTGMSWGPGLTLIATDGTAVKVGVRARNTYNVISPSGEEILTLAAPSGLKLDRDANDFTVTEILPVQEPGVQRLRAVLTDAETSLRVAWEAELRDGSNYIRQGFTISGEKPTVMYGLQLVDFQNASARQIGKVPGSPVITDSFFSGIELPVTSNFLTAEGFRSGFGCDLPIDPSTRYHFATVAGVYPQGQVRRAFQTYLERERAMPSRPFLHYNNWYDFAPSEENFTRVIAAYGEELTRKRGITLDAFVMDDGWDNCHEGLWTFHRERFPQGFGNVAAAAQSIGSNLGIWISPLGGYGGVNERTAHAKRMGLIEDRFDLSQPAYYDWYLRKCLELIQNYGVNYFKWDKAGSGVDPHFMALLRIAGELKSVKPDLYLNVTVGTWPSPFWLNHVDCTWRDGSGDVSWHGPGDKRESWLTYRDMSCYRLVVQRAPLYPINSLMHHGLVNGFHYQGKDVGTAGSEYRNAARSYFAMGPNLQELYLSVEQMTQASWDQIAEAVKWNQAHREILVDAHWVGGDPGLLKVYGVAAWQGERGTLMLRNPDEKQQRITLDVAEVFELPPHAPRQWRLENAYPDQTYDAPRMNAGEPLTFTL